STSGVYKTPFSLIILIQTNKTLYPLKDNINY
ncbi:unnamed protein product, partial [marine sediment metagenome]